jgi:hypothetical protein
MAVIEMGTEKLRPQNNYTASACDARCVTESVQERQYVYMRLYCSSQHLSSEQRIGKMLVL